MLDDYQNSQPITYRILKNAIINDKYSHAYLFETNGFNDSFNFILAFVKSLLCPHKKLNKKDCPSCHQCQVIDSGNFPEIKIINPDGLWIKKEQLRELQSEFKEKALIGNKRIYIINHAEKLNKSAANSILKFLEEPEGNIVAILITDNTYSVLETIVSRCQVLRLKESSNKKSQNEIETIKNIICLNHEDRETIIASEDIDLKIQKIFDFVNYYEIHHLDTLLYMNKVWNEYIKTKEEMIDAFDIMIMYYKDVINYKVGNKMEIFTDDKNITKIAEKNKLKDLCRKLKVIMDKKQNIRYNANTNLLMDKLIIDLEGGI